MADINAISSSANRLIYHGSAHGPFGGYGFKSPVSCLDLDSISVLKVSLEHLSNFPLSDDYDYQIIYLDKQVYEALWNGSKKNKIPGLKNLTNQACLHSQANLKPKTQKIFLSAQKNRSISVTPYEQEQCLSCYIPEDYYADFKEKFKGLLVRTKKECSQLCRLLEAHGLKIIEQREVLDDVDGNLQIACYA